MDIKKKFSTNKIARYVYFFTIISAITAVYGVFIFLYNNFYIAITQSDVIIILKRDVATEIVDVNKFNEIIARLEKKITTHVLRSGNNPFD